jgi:hypothetical protein
MLFTGRNPGAWLHAADDSNLEDEVGALILQEESCRREITKVRLTSSS